MTIAFDTHPTVYKHWRLSCDGDLATLALCVKEDGGLVEGYQLKLNSYDLGVDIELADAVQRIRFEYPQVSSVLIKSDNEKVFCSGANIKMLGQSTHAFKVNFCKFTNETRLAIEDASASSGIQFLAALSGATAGGGYELALACDEIVLIDDGNSAVSLPEVPLLGVLPGTGGLTRLVDKRHVRRDLADLFNTTAEGVRGKRAQEWGLVDAVIPKSEWHEGVAWRARELAKKGRLVSGPGVVLDTVSPYQYVRCDIDNDTRIASIHIEGPRDVQPSDAESILKLGASNWFFRVFRELENALLNLRFNHNEIGIISFQSHGNAQAVLDLQSQWIQAAQDKKHGWFPREVIHYVKRVLKRLDVSSRSLVSLIEKESIFVGALAELVWASDRSFMRDDEAVHLGVGELNLGLLPMGNGLTRLESRFFGHTNPILPDEKPQLLNASECQKFGLATRVLDEIDYDDEVRLFLEERASLSSDALSGLEANLRFVGPETMETKIFGRLSAWQNWIFVRDNATGETGALTCYGKPQRAVFDRKRC